MNPGADGTGLPPACVPEEDGSCSVCGDEGLMAEVLEVAAGGRSGRVRLENGGVGPPEGSSDPRPGSPPTGSRERTVALDLLDDVEPGDRVVVHLGFAIARVREDLARTREGRSHG